MTEGQCAMGRYSPAYEPWTYVNSGNHVIARSRASAVHYRETEPAVIGGETEHFHEDVP